MTNSFNDLFESAAKYYPLVPLDESKADEIRQLAASGQYTKAQIAAMTGAHYSQVHSTIKSMANPNIKSGRGENKSDKVRELAAAGGMTIRQIADETSAHPSQVHAIVKAMGDLANVVSGKRGRTPGSTTATPSTTQTTAAQTLPKPPKAAPTLPPAKKVATDPAPSDRISPRIQNDIELELMAALQAVETASHQELLDFVVTNLHTDIVNRIPAEKIGDRIGTMLQGMVDNGEVFFNPDTGEYALLGAGETAPDEDNVEPGADWFERMLSKRSRRPGKSEYWDDDDEVAFGEYSDY